MAYHRIKIEMDNGTKYTIDSTTDVRSILEVIESSTSSNFLYFTENGIVDTAIRKDKIVAIFEK